MDSATQITLNQSVVRRLPIREAIVAIVGLLCLGVFAMELSQHRFFAVIVAQLRGQPLAFTPVATTIVPEAGVDMCVFSIDARNLTSEPIRLIGAETFCGCVTVDDVPMTIPAHAKVTFHVKWAAADKKARDPSRVIKIFSDNPNGFSNEIAMPQ
jgi:hypothetical protein